MGEYLVIGLDPDIAKRGKKASYKIYNMPFYENSNIMGSLRKYVCTSNHL